MFIVQVWIPLTENFYGLMGLTKTSKCLHAEVMIYRHLGDKLLHGREFKSFFELSQLVLSM